MQSEKMSTLLIGFDSAWTPTNSGAIVGVLIHEDGTFQELGEPASVDYPRAKRLILNWQEEYLPNKTIVMLDQPTIVSNAAGQRPVEHIVSSSVCKRYGAMQPANTGRREMFGVGAPMWSFLDRFGGPANPLAPFFGTGVFETYPVLLLISFGWVLPDLRPAGRLPKYNPERTGTFSLSDWEYLCIQTCDALQRYGLIEMSRLAKHAASLKAPRKKDQDSLDAYLCLLAGVHLACGKECLMVGNHQSGYIVVPHCANLCNELEERCKKTGRSPSEWVRTFFAAATSSPETLS